MSFCGFALQGAYSEATACIGTAGEGRSTQSQNRWPWKGPWKGPWRKDGSEPPNPEKPSESMVEDDKASTKRPIGETPPPKTKQSETTKASPAIKRKAKRSKGTSSKPDEIPEPSVENPPSESKGEDQKEGEQVPGGDQKVVKLPSKAHIDSAMAELKDAKSDDASWEHVCKLFAATKNDPKKCKHVFQYWTYSMYWHSKRVGLLQKGTATGTRHILSFGGTFCPHIGIPAEACRLYVCSLFFNKAPHMPTPCMMHEAFI